MDKYEKMAYPVARTAEEVTDDLMRFIGDHSINNWMEGISEEDATKMKRLWFELDAIRRKG